MNDQNNTPQPVWTPEAHEVIEKAPEFVREMAREMIEDFAKDEGAVEITVELVKRARAKFGM
ncbi:MAG: PCP reductase family protein [Nitrospinota bacterium]|nr:PCP reductase family protein [Nitrospinota bacterium]